MASPPRGVFSPRIASRSAVIDVASAGLLVLGAGDASRLPAPVSVAYASVFIFALGRFSVRLARFLLPREDRATTATASLVLLVACWTVAGTALGHAGALTPRAVLLLAALGLLASALLPARPAAPAERPPGVAHLLERTAIRAAIAFFGISTAIAVFSQRLAPPGARGYDDTSYHLSAVATWWQWHDLRSIKFPVGDGSTTFYPIVGELFSFLLLSPLGGTDFLARWSDAPFAVGSLAALLSLSRLLFLREEAAGIAVLLYAACPRVFPLGMLGAGNDHAVGFFVLASACGALLLRSGPDPGRAAFLGASLGLLAGTKYTGVMFLPPLLVMAGLCAAGTVARAPAEGRSRAFRSAALGALVSLSAMIGVCGYVYLRNAAGAHNPFYPATIGVWGRRLFQGWGGDTVAELRTTGLSFGESLRFLWERVDLFGPLFRWCLLPAAVLAPLLALGSWVASRSRRLRTVPGGRTAAGEVVLFALPAFLYLTFVRLMVDHRDIRYFLGAVALAGLAVAWLLERLPPRAARFGRLAVLVAVSTVLVAAHVRREGAANALFAAALAGVVLFPIVFGRFLPGRLTHAGSAGVLALSVVLAAAATIAAPAGGRILEDYLAHKLDPDPAAVFVDGAAPPGTTIDFCGGNRPYLFFGRRLQNRLLFVPTFRGPRGPGGNPSLGASFFSWNGPLEFPRYRAVHDEWRENLVRLGVRFVVVVSTGDEFPERDWIALEPEAFTRVFHDARTEVFSFRDVRGRPDRLRVDFGRPESDFFLLSGRGPAGGDGRGRALVVAAEGVDLMIPALDTPAVAVGLEVDERDAPVPLLRASLNGRPMALLASDARALTFRVERAAWQRGRNRLSILPPDAAPTRNVRLAALDLALDATHPLPSGGSGELLGNLDFPAEGTAIRPGTLSAGGWCRARGGGRIDPVRFTIDGRDVVPLRASRPDRPDVVAAIPDVREPRETGFAVDLDARGLAPGRHVLVVDLETPDGRLRRLPARSFNVVR